MPKVGWRKSNIGKIYRQEFLLPRRKVVKGGAKSGVFGRYHIYAAKSKSVHFRQSRSPRSKQALSVGINIIETVESYKYLGVIFQERQDFSSTAKASASGAGRTLDIGKYYSQNAKYERLWI